MVRFITRAETNIQIVWVFARLAYIQANFATNLKVFLVIQICYIILIILA